MDSSNTLGTSIFNLAKGYTCMVFRWASCGLLSVSVIWSLELGFGGLDC